MKLDFLAVSDIIIFSQGMLLALLFLTSKRGNRAANILLGLFIFTQHFGILHAFFLNSGLTSQYTYLLNVPSFFLHWIAPLLYLYALSLIRIGFHWKKAYGFYFLLPLTELAGNLLLLFWGADQLIPLLGVSTFGKIIDASSIVAVCNTLILLPMAFSEVKLAEHHHMENKRIFKWLNLVLIYYMFRSLLVLLYIIGMSIGLEKLLTTYWNDVLIFFTALDLTATLFLSYISFRSMQDIHSKQKLPTHHVNLKDSQFYFTKLTELMTNDRLYRKSDLKVSELAVALNINAKYVALLVKQHTQLSVSQYINSYRVEEIKANIVKRSNFLTLQAIGEECGFNSKATFNRVFKETTGMNPREYKEHTSMLTKEVSNSEKEAQ